MELQIGSVISTADLTGTLSIGECWKLLTIALYDSGNGEQTRFLGFSADYSCRY